MKEGEPFLIRAVMDRHMACFGLSDMKYIPRCLDTELGLYRVQEIVGDETFNYVGVKPESDFRDLMNKIYSAPPFEFTLLLSEDRLPDKYSTFDDQGRLFIGRMLCEECGLPENGDVMVIGHDHGFMILDEDSLERYIQKERGGESLQKFKDMVGKREKVA